MVRAECTQPGSETSWSKAVLFPCWLLLVQRPCTININNPTSCTGGGRQPLPDIPRCCTLGAEDTSCSAGGDVRPGGGQPLRACHRGVRVERQHGAHHEGAGPARHLHVVLHVLQEDPGDQPRQQHHAGTPLPAAAGFRAQRSGWRLWCAPWLSHLEQQQAQRSTSLGPQLSPLPELGCIAHLHWAALPSST